MSEADTIVAPASPIGRSALAIVRIDGSLALKILRQLSSLEVFEPRRATLVRLRDEAGAIDEAVAIFYAAPASFTGNDLVEITAHGSPGVVARLLEAVMAQGARMAEPGEFTERAVLNGKMDLVQAEAIGELIDSRTSLQARLSLRHLEGELSRLGESLRERLVDVISRLEAALDFSDEGYEFISRSEAGNVLGEMLEELDQLVGSYRRGRATIEGLTAVILGKPNAGKSTLLNFLCGSDRAIVTPVPGTTRDLLRETVEIGGLPVTLVDTAGIRGDAELVEEIGIARAREVASGAEIVLYLIDAERGEDQEDEWELERLPGAIRLFTKSDLAPVPEGEMGISVRSGEGMDHLIRFLDRLVRDRYVVPEGAPAIVTERQRRAIVETREALGAATAALNDGMEEEIILVDLYRASRTLGLLTGRIGHEEIVAEIFSKFCIGK